MRLLFLGSGAFGLPTMQSLYESHEVVGVLTSEDRRAGRKQRMSPTPIATYAMEHGITVYKTSDVNSSEMVDIVDSLRLDAMVVIAFGQKLQAAIIGDRFAINLHGSLLPRWRGAAPINAAILHGDELSGVSVITLAQRMDAGLILGQLSTHIGDSETAGELHDRLAMLGPNLVNEVLTADGSGDIQDESLVTYAPKLTRGDAKLDLSLDADSVARTIRGYSPWPGCHIMIGGIDCKLLRAITKHNMEKHGEIGEILTDGSMAVGIGSIEIMELQPAGGRPMTWKEFCNGRSVKAGDTCEVRS